MKVHGANITYNQLITKHFRRGCMNCKNTLQTTSSEIVSYIIYTFHTYGMLQIDSSEILTKFAKDKRAYGESHYHIKRNRIPAYPAGQARIYIIGCQLFQHRHLGQQKAPCIIPY